MNHKVYTYTKISELKNASYFADIVALPQLTMSGEVAADMVFEMRGFRGNLFSFSSFVPRLFPNWNTNGQKFAYATVLNHFLQNKIINVKDKATKDWLSGCKKNMHSVIYNILRLEEAKVRPEDLPQDDRDLILLKEMWSQLEKSTDNIINFRQRLSDLENPEKFDKEITTIFKFRGGRKQIVWHGFQFLTPIQQFVYDCFVRAGYEIIALLQDDPRYPYANEIWDNLYNKENGYPERKDWIRQADSIERNILGEILENGKAVENRNVKIIKYNNTVEFVEDIPRMKEEGFYIYSTDDHNINDMLKDYFPERYEQRNLLAYPIGQFIYTLHKMWDENYQSLVLGAEGLRKCFASGWLSVEGKSSTHFTDDLERLLPYFEGCYTIEQWGERLNILSESFDEAYDAFTVEKVSEEKINEKEVLGNPLRYFSAFSMKEDHIVSVIQLISQLIRMARKLFGANEPVSIQEHMNKLDALLYMEDGMPRDLYIEEREKVKQIFEVLESDKIKDFICYPGDLASALISFMSGRLDDEDKNNKGLKTLVFNIFQVEAAPISSKGKVHICMSDISRLPGSAANYKWPLDEEVLTDTVKRKDGTYLHNWLRVNQLTILSNRYYIYTALNNPNVEISWISQQGDKLLAPSPYVTLLQKLGNIEICETQNRRLDMQYVSGIMAHKRFERQYDITDHHDLYVYDSELEYALCPMRFVYSNVLGDGVTYRSEYQQSRALVRFIQAIKKVLGDKYSVEQIAEQVFELFPYIRSAERRQMIDDALRWAPADKGEGYTRFGGYNYTNARLNMTFIDNACYDKAKKVAALLMSQKGQKNIYAIRGSKIESRNCEFCPHMNYCREGIFGVDYKAEDT